MGWVSVASVKNNRFPVPTLFDRLHFSFAQHIGLIRFFWFTRVARKKLKTFALIDKSSAGLGYSKSHFVKYGPDARIHWTMFLLVSIPDLDKSSLLILGPRYETEILLAHSLGFKKRSVRGLDTYSYSPLIDVGDMHKLPYNTSSYKNIICGWTLSYSADPQKAADEMDRVLQPGGYIVLSVQKVANDFKETINGIPSGEHRIQTLAQFDKLFANLKRVAGFEPMSVGDSSHLLVAYHKPEEVNIKCSEQL